MKNLLFKQINFRLKPLFGALLGAFTLIMIFGASIGLAFSGGSTPILLQIFLWPVIFLSVIPIPVFMFTAIMSVYSIFWYVIISLLSLVFNRNQVTTVKNFRLLDIIIMVILAFGFSYLALIFIQPTNKAHSLTSPFVNNVTVQEDQARNDAALTNSCPLNKLPTDNNCFAVTNFTNHTSMTIPVGAMIMVSLDKTFYPESLFSISAPSLLAPSDFKPTAVMDNGINMIGNDWSQSYIAVKEGEFDITAQDSNFPNDAYSVHITIVGKQ